MRKLSKDILLAPALFLLIGLIYLFTAPRTVQTGDSGELALAAYQKLVAHPPGYPLWIWMNHAWLNVSPIENVFHSLSIFCILMTIVTLWLLFESCSNRSGRKWGLFLVATLACGPYFWKYAIIPEVFSLNLLLCAAIICFAFNDFAQRSTRVFAVPVLFGLGLANHLTIVFLGPLMLWHAWTHRRNSWYWVGCIVGIGLFVGLYSSMLLLDTKNLYSWGDLQGLNDIIRHFLRSEYGTLKLVRSSNEVGSADIYLYFANVLLLHIWPLIVGCLICLFLKKKSKESILWTQEDSILLICIGCYLCVFVLMGQAKPLGFFSDVLPRFFLMPVLMISMLSARFLSANFSLNKWQSNMVASSCFGILLISFGIHRSHNDFSYNTIVEDFSLNLLKTAEGRQKSIILTEGDTELFATRFVQQVQRVNLDTPVMIETQLTYRWMYQKLQQRYSDFVMDMDSIDRKEHFSPFNDIIKPNGDRFTFVSTWDVYRAPRVKVVYLPTARIVSNGSQMEIGTPSFIPTFRADSSIIETSPYTFDAYRAIFAKYAYYFLADAEQKIDKGNDKGAIDSLERALGIVPYCLPALRGLCTLKERNGLQDPKCSNLPMLKEFFPYFETPSID